MAMTRDELRVYNREAQRRWREKHKPSLPPALGHGHVYLFRKGDLYKIGQTANIKVRQGAVASVYRTDIQIVYSVQVPYPALVEMEWAWRFRHQRAKETSRRIGATEWYTLSDQDIAWICAQRGDEVLHVECSMDLNEAIDYLQKNQARITFLPSQRVRIHLPTWSGYYVERDTIIEAACVVRERLEVF